MDWTRNIRVRQLRMLLRLCETKNLSYVAKEFNLTQPALSKWLKEFEVTLGAPLFTRHSKGLQPTPLALELVRQAENILVRFDRVQYSINQIKNVASTQISIGISPIVIQTSLSKSITSFHIKNPKTFIKFSINTFDKLLVKLREGEIDVVIARTEKDAPLHDLSKHNLAKIQLRLMVNLNHPLAKESSVSWEQAMSYPWIAPPAESPIRQKMDLALKNMGVGPAPVLIESTSVNLSVSLLENTNLIAAFSSKSIEPIGPNHYLNLPNLNNDLDASITLIWSPENSDYELLQQLIEHIKTTF